MANIDLFRPRHPLGPQIHAVPDREKAYDSAGNKLPWAYDTTGGFSKTENSDREQQARSREPAEKGAFGKSRGSRRNTSRSRSKTAEPKSVEDERRREQAAAEERVFGSMRKVVREETGRSALGEVDGNTVAQPNAPSTAAARGKMTDELEATEVLLYGFGEDLQWSAIDFYERVSGGGTILEDYDRTPQSQLRAFDPTHSISRATLTRSLSKIALRKKNTWAGGEHWIKVTFSSREAAELVCERSPHIVKGHLVYAEPWQGRGPARDEPIHATQAGVQATSGNLPSSFSTNNLIVETSPNGSQTISSRTAAGEEDVEEPWQPRSMQSTSGGAAYYGGSNSMSTSATLPFLAQSGSQQLQHRSNTGTLTRLPGAQRATLLPAEQALMPRPPKASWTAWLGGGEVIGTTVPRREDGAFDYERASLYWRAWMWVDILLGTDLCGLRAD
ncbi:hypothetical protein LTR35_000654 [Friedmanniomyces endolithicus]|nr:hypothetical protein LTS00_012173 [Friedmanniomyces endolithicus]KAK0292623.1 hypothetical protein LTR35_000654 [Friedmanniomyces endolithicus]KAK1007636.1 hypothetical protein LTR54_006362 [Friedmanniomyces endolithicus]